MKTRPDEKAPRGRFDLERSYPSRRGQGFRATRTLLVPS